uniref:Transposase-associated domain-containing protein n=1 Tax=Setaria italica TaxID=4555 RepID=K3YZR0_SETIT
MDRRWIHGCQLFTPEHEKGVNDFMKFVKSRYSDNDQILCLCCGCRISLDVLIRMASTYTRWIHHGETFEDRIQKNANLQDNGVQENAILRDDRVEEIVVLLDEDAGTKDGLPKMIADMCDAKELEGKMLECIKDYLKRKVSPGSKCTQFTFVVKLLYIKSFYQISNVAFNAILTVLFVAFPGACVPTSYDDAMKYIRAMGLGYESIHVCKKIFQSKETVH